MSETNDIERYDLIISNLREAIALLGEKKFDAEQELNCALRLRKGADARQKELAV